MIGINQVHLIKINEGKSVNFLFWSKNYKKYRIIYHGYGGTLTYLVPKQVLTEWFEKGIISLW